MAKSIGSAYSEGDPFNDRVVLVFRVADVDQSYERLQSKVKFLLTPTSTPYGIRCANFRDPAGTLIELYHEIPIES
ncbi:VOC family protein [Paenibacillus cellulosilyticus]|uniref:VOC family protein n=1 Tax=Paenibacillus cellulosilyticus TaxID=375489 RepID=UPI001FE65F9F|nr:VOC family protein [Paenibacillus cellulosilyticus]